MLLAVSELIKTLQAQISQLGKGSTPSSAKIDNATLPEVTKVGWNELRIEEYLGKGSYGTVYKA